ncbi:MAG: hypothetical protein HFH68_04215 [Lachnospiraceae bacterium]|nr:hypothetical protein [Lachnospiraceae bacterium]
MDKKIFKLDFGSGITRLAGNPYGREVYDKQLRGKIDFNNISVIVFPKEIENIASSFVQGFFADIVDNIGFGGVKAKIEIQANEKVKEKVQKSLGV